MSMKIELMLAATAWSFVLVKEISLEARVRIIIIIRINAIRGCINVAIAYRIYNALM